MGERTERAVLNRLIASCRDAERGFLAASEHVQSKETRRLFLRLASQRREFAEELLPYAYRLGGATTTDGTGVAALHRAWMQVKARFAADPEHAVVEEAARGERFAIAAYDAAVHDLLPPEARPVVEAQDLGVRVAGRLVREAVTH